MATTVSISELKQQIENQKLDAINGTVHVFADITSSREILSTSQQLGTLLCNPAAFTVHQYSAGKNQLALTRNIAQCIPRIIVCAVVDDNFEMPARWVYEVFPTYINKIPGAEIEWIRINKVPDEEKDFLNQFNVFENPTVLVFKMGHLIDKFVPNIYGTDDSDENSLQPLEGPKKGHKEDLLKHTSGYDPGREDYEERQRIKQEKEEEEKWREEILEKKRIRERIAAQRKEQMERNKANGLN